MWHVKGCMYVQIGSYVSYRLNNCSGWHRQKKNLHNSFNLFICLLWLVFLFKTALIKMH